MYVILSHDMAKKTVNEDKYDKHIIDALMKLKMPIVGIGGISFYIRDESRYEDGIHHIASKRHRLKVRDVESISDILRHPKMVRTDPHNRNYKNYYGIRRGDNSSMLIKIVTWPYEHNPKMELIVTIYPTKSIKVD